MEASRSPQIPSSDHRRCPHSCRGTRRLYRGPRSAATRGINGPGAPSSPPMRSRYCLRRGGTTGAQAGPDGSEVVLPTPWHPGDLLSPPTWPGTLPDPRARVERPWHLCDKPGLGGRGDSGPDCKKQNTQQRGRPASPPGSWGMVWRGSQPASREQPSPTRAPRTCSAGRQYVLRLKGVVGSRGSRLVVTVSLLALDKERTRHDGRARSPRRSKGPWSLCRPNVTRVFCSAPTRQTCERRTGWKHGSVCSGPGNAQPGGDRTRAGEERERRAGGGAWPRCATLTRWHSDRWREPAAVAATAQRYNLSRGPGSGLFLLPCTRPSAPPLL